MIEDAKEMDRLEMENTIMSAFQIRKCKLFDDIDIYRKLVGHTNADTFRGHAPETLVVTSVGWKPRPDSCLYDLVIEVELAPLDWVIGGVINFWCSAPVDYSILD